MRGFWKLHALILAAAVLTVVAGQVLLEDPSPGDLEGRISSWIGVGLERRAEAELHRLVKLELHNIETHYRWITLHCSLGERAAQSHQTDSIEAFYRKLTSSDDGRLADIGRYGLGLIISAREGDPAEALAHFDTVVDRELPYLSNSIGRCLMRLGRHSEAINHFEREIAIGGNTAGAYLNLAVTLLEQGHAAQLAQMIEDDPMVAERLPGRVLRQLAFARGDVWAYAKRLLIANVQAVNLPGLLAAGLILGVWLVFLRGLDVFEPEQTHALAITLGLGMITAIVCTVPYDLVRYGLGLSLNGSPLNDLLYCVLVIGLIEETVKLLPLLVVVRWTVWVDEPVDVAIYGATSALGFAFVENLAYLHPQGLANIHARAFSATLLHMALTTIASYGLVLAIGRRLTRSQAMRTAAGWFVIAVLAHGTYDFWLGVDIWAGALRPLALLTLLLAALAFKNAVINGLSWSPFWNDGTRQRMLQRWRYLGLSLSAILLVEYWLLAASYGPTAAAHGFLGAALSSWLLVLILTAQLGVLEIRRQHWLPLLSHLTPRRARASVEPRPPEVRPPEG